MAVLRFLPKTIPCLMAFAAKKGKLRYSIAPVSGANDPAGRVIVPFSGYKGSLFSARVQSAIASQAPGF
jgi:hypothetical protein